MTIVTMFDEGTDAVRRYTADYQALLNSSGRNKFVPPLTPFYCDADMVGRFSSLVEKYHNILEHVASEYDRFSGHLGFDGDFHALLSSLPSYQSNVVLGRLDVFPTPLGLRAIEANAESPGGAEECDTIEGLFGGAFPDLVSGTSSRRRVDGYLDAILGAYAEQALEKGVVPSPEPRLVLLEWPEDVASHGDRYDIFLNRARARGVDASIASPDEVGCGGGFGVVDGAPVDVFYRRFLLHELPENHPEGYDLIRRLEGSSSAVVNPARSKCVGSKQLLALVSDPSYESLFPGDLLDDLRYVRGFTPATYSLLHPEALPFSRADASLSGKDYVLKAGNGASSTAVWVGSDHSLSSWKGLMERAWGGDYVLQETVPLPEKRVGLFSGGEREASMFYLLSPYMVDGSFAGLYARATENNLLSSDAGGLATILPVYER